MKHILLFVIAVLAIQTTSFSQDRGADLRQDQWVKSQMEKQNTQSKPKPNVVSYTFSFGKLDVDLNGTDYSFVGRINYTVNGNPHYCDINETINYDAWIDPNVCEDHDIYFELDVTNVGGSHVLEAVAYKNQSGSDKKLGTIYQKVPAPNYPVDTTNDVSIHGAKGVGG